MIPLLERYDPACVDERVHDAEINFYIMAQGAVQGIVNMSTAGLY